MEVCSLCGARKNSGNAYDACPTSEHKAHEWFYVADYVPETKFVSAPTPLTPLSPPPTPPTPPTPPPDFGTPGHDEDGNALPQSGDIRSNLPLYSGCFDYFEKALAYVALVSLSGAEKYCGGVLGWDRSKSTNQLDRIARHLMDIKGRDPSTPQRLRHAGMLAWRALAFLQIELEKAEARGEPW